MGILSLITSILQLCSNKVIINNLLILKVLAGGRGKGHFAKYPKGGVQLLYNTDEIEEAAKGMIGKNQYLL